MTNGGLEPGAHGDGRCRLCAGILAAARTARRAARTAGARGRAAAPTARRFWEAAVGGHLQLVASPRSGDPPVASEPDA